MEVKPNTLSFRGKSFSDVEEYAKYILKCKEGDRVKAEQEQQNKLKAEKEKRIEELIQAKKELKNTAESAYEVCESTINLAKEKYNEIENNFYKDYPRESIYTITSKSLEDAINNFFVL